MAKLQVPTTEPSVLTLSSDRGADVAHCSARSHVAAFLAGALGVCLIAGCGDNHDPAQIGTRPWGSIDVAVELRPPPPRPGHNEVVVIITGEHHRPVYDALVSVRGDGAQPWVQAIEDGHVGVYRRAVVFAHGPQATLQVRVQRADAQTVLEFPVTLLP
jgi:hypothetical protein